MACMIFSTLKPGALFEPPQSAVYFIGLMHFQIFISIISIVERVRRNDEGLNILILVAYKYIDSIVLNAYRTVRRIRDETFS